MRRTSARFRLISSAAVTAAAVAFTGVTAFSGSAAETGHTGNDARVPRPLAANQPIGFGAGTTGGAGGATVTVSNASQFAEAVQRSEPLVVQVNGTVSLSSMTKVASNKTVIGVGTAGRITGSGLNVSKADNVIIRNLTFSGSNDDAINVQYATRVWIDHNDISGAKDGAIDIKRASDNITVSWNRVHDHDKSFLLGHSDGNGGEDSGKLRVTYHHNWFDGTNQRHPRVRFGNPVHVLNNYYSDIGSYGVASTENAGVLVEGNYFENVEDPFHLGEGSSDPGSLQARNNHFVNSGRGETGGSVAAIPYGYTADNAANVKSIVTAGAGVGKI
ncbi:right-handed parallel beta-helix repeat-containing protein [Streptomyces sp. TRM 70361]|uniref:pectate lyase family protein n=1 Tax=Streptomyces sp. TRM 70361 TaxID=3116553 RepID=UPI002E7B5E90|nr:right-handed parallel beta-helix repeat-containing protein [Streptomyces sp. TRM 70361]MEE1941266.1 right-handed parallel beta-helix repeat-containing protein [Streptomyces sp. TRM 70361]